MASHRHGFNSPEEKAADLVQLQLLHQTSAAQTSLQSPQLKFPAGWSQVYSPFLGYSHLHQFFLVFKYEKRKYHFGYSPGELPACFHQLYFSLFLSMLINHNNQNTLQNIFKMNFHVWAHAGLMIFIITLPKHSNVLLRHFTPLVASHCSRKLQQNLISLSVTLPSKVTSLVLKTPRTSWQGKIRTPVQPSQQ